MIKQSVKSLLMAVVVVGLVAIAMPALADRVVILYTNDVNESVALVIDEESSEADLKLAATLILTGGVEVTTTPKGTGTLSNIIANISTAAADVASGDTTNISTATAAIEAAVPTEIYQSNIIAEPAAGVTLETPSVVPSGDPNAGVPLDQDGNVIDQTGDTTGGNQTGDQGGTTTPPPITVTPPPVVNPPVATEPGTETSNPGLN